MHHNNLKNHTKKKLFSTTVVILFLSGITFGQATPKTPKTTSSSTTKSNSYSISFDTDAKEGNSSVSIKINDNICKFSAKFHESKFKSLKKLIVDQLGDKNLTVYGDRYSWIKTENR